MIGALRRLGFALIAALVALPASAQIPGGSPIAYLYCWTGTAWLACSSTNSLNVTGNVGGYDSGSFPIQTATPNSSSHAAGSSVGGLFSIPVARTNGGGGIITTFYWTSTGGATTQLLVRLWDKNPTNTTCTDQTAFVESATDDEHLLTVPFTMTPVAPANTTGDSNTYASVTGLTLSFKNQDGTAGKNVYACVVTTATDTADESKAVYINATGPQD